MSSTNKPKSLFEKLKITSEAFDEAENKLNSALESGTFDEDTISELIANVEELGNKLTEITNRLDSNVRDQEK